MTALADAATRRGNPRHLATGGLHIARALVAALTLGGCAQSSGTGTEQGVGTALVRSVQETMTKAFEAGKRGAQDLVQGKQRRPLERYCESLEESYDVVDNLVALMVASGSQSFLAWQRSGYQITAQSSKELTEIVGEVSKNHLWMPVAVEQQIGAAQHKEFPEEKIIKRGQGRRARTIYDKADKALAAAVKDYPKLPYELNLFVIDSDVVNAEALPAGYIYLTSKTALDLDADALQLVLGHEVAHVAKRHTSKQVQQRIVETGAGVDMLKHVMQGGNTAAPQSVFAGWGILKRLEGKFARYDQEQELQADACSIRGLVYADLDPIKARREYVRKRGTEAARPASGSAPARQPQVGLGFTEHPDDEVRERSFVEATNFHRVKAQRRTTPSGETLAAPPVSTPSSPDTPRKLPEAASQAAPAACEKIEPEKSVRSDAEPLYTKLSNKDRRRLQTALCLKDKDVDGIWGSKSKYSLKRYECRMGRDPDGKLTDAQVADLLKLADDEVAKRCHAE